jgi:hypothetical protein
MIMKESTTREIKQIITAGLAFREREVGMRMWDAGLLVVPYGNNSNKHTE